MNLTEKFITECKVKHLNKYDYSKTIYRKTRDKVIITCPTHGDFEQRAGDHKAGHNCPKCSNIIAHNKLTFTTEKFIEKAASKHNNKYSYQNTVYISALKKVTITCPIHGDFEQEASSHLRGYGCNACGNKQAQQLNVKSTNDFLVEAKSKHKDTYDYTKTSYVSAKTKVTITCNTHGDFTVIPRKHIIGQGCPICSGLLKKFTKTFYANKKTILYVLYLPDFNVYKVGITSKSIAQRYKEEGNINYIVVFEQHFFNGIDAWTLEKLILRDLKIFKYDGSPIFKKTNIAEILCINPIPTITKRILNGNYT